MITRGSSVIGIDFLEGVDGAMTTACVVVETVATTAVGGSMYVRFSQIFGMGLKEGCEPSRVFLLRGRGGDRS